VEQLAEEFTERYRRGERPSLAEYTSRYPELADQIRELFPALVEMEQLASVEGPHTGPYAPAASGSRSPPQQLGEYRILREIGHGGMGVVYEAVQESLGRHVALKVLPLHGLLSPTQRERFRREARAAARLHHTNIVPVFGVGEDGGIHYYAMQFIQGQGLDMVLDEVRRLRGRLGLAAQADGAPADELSVCVARGLISGQFRGPLADGGEAPEPAPPTVDPAAAGPEDLGGKASGPNCVGHSLRECQPTRGASGLHSGSTSADTASGSRLTSLTESQYFRSVAQVGVQVADALAYAHKQGVLHRDIKPSNLLLDTAGTVWITDFGLAKADDSDDLTHTGDLVGTLRFMAPERLEGRCDLRSEVYGVGVTLYELATLRPAFAASDRLALLEQVRCGVQVRPSRCDPRIPRDLETIILKAMARDPAERYATAEALAEDLRRFLADRPIRARRASAAERLWRWCRRNRVVASLAAAVLLMVLTVAVGSTVAAIRLGQALNDTERAKADADARLWESLLVQARATRKSGRPGQRFDSLRAIQEAMKLPLPPGHSLDELRTEAIAALLLPDIEVAREWDGWPTGSLGFAIDNTFERYARGDKDGNVSVRRLADDVELFRLTGARRCEGDHGLLFSPDGRYLHLMWQVGQGWRSRLWRLEGLQPVAVLEENHSGVAFRPDSQVLAAANVDGSIRLYDTSTGQELGRWSAGVTQRTLLDWHPRLPRLAVVTPTGWQVIDLETQKVLQEAPLPRSETYPMIQWHPEGRLLAVANGTSIALWDTQTGRPLRLREGTSGGTIVRFNRAGDRLFSNDWSGVLRVWDVRTGRQLLSRPSAWAPLYFSPDDGLLGVALADPKAQVFHYRAGREFRTVVQPDHADGKHSGYLHWAVLGTGGRLQAVNSHRGVALVDVARSEEIAILPPAANRALRFEADDQAVWTYGGGRLLRWPIHPAAADGQMHSVGPAEHLGSRLLTVDVDVGSSSDGNIIAIPNFNRGALLWQRRTNRTLTLGPQDDVRRCAVSPDGRWVATGTHWLFQGVGAKVWEAETRRHVVDLPVPGLCHVWFSPDGKWLVTNAGGFRIWEVGTWREGPALGGPAYYGTLAFSPDGNLLALGDDPGVVRLVLPDTGKEIARLTAPEQTRLQPQCFTPDGGQLITVGKESLALHIFDLRAIREQLKELGLDWDSPPLPPVKDAAAPQPLRVKVELGDLKPSAREGAREKIKRCTRAFQANPNNAATCNSLAWVYLTAPEALRDVKQAIALAQKAVRLVPNNPIHANTLGLAHYRAGQYREAVKVLQLNWRRMEDRHLAFDLIILAMSYYKLGKAERAREYFDWAVRWSRTQKDLSPQPTEELDALRAEAEKLLRRAKP
jgi:serine/threonine protein kinase/WD40 repeat protein